MTLSLTLLTVSLSTLHQAAKLVEKDCDAIDINFGCPQRIAKRGFYGAFLMDNLPLIEKLVSELVNVRHLYSWSGQDLCF
jgi:tRNA-dihydrouridine synthase